MSHDALSIRMKSYEKAMQQRFIPLLPVVVRIDGKNFSRWTKGLDKPFDADMINIMQQVTKRLVKETRALVGYTQSDEISLIFYSDNPESQIFFDGKIFKMTSVLASMTTAYFNKIVEHAPVNLGCEVDKFYYRPLAFFDCRVWQVPTKQEAINYLIWRELDAVRNSIQSVGQANFSHKQLHHKNQNEIQEMLFQEKGINWNNYSPSEKRGSYFSRQTTERAFTTNEIDKLPPKHEARSNPNLIITRQDIIELEIPRLTQITNPMEVIFNGEKPTITKTL